MDPRIDQARARHGHSLVGAWSTAQGSFDAVMGQHWTIRPDGTGCFIDTGPFGHPRSETQFVWRQHQPFAFELRETGFVDHEADTAEDGEEDDFGGAAWVTITYDFVVVGSDGGEHVCLVDARPHEATEPRAFFFYFSLAPLAFRDPR